MTAISVRPPRSLTIPLSASLLLHVGVAAAFLLVKTSPRRLNVPQAFAVTLVSAPRTDVLEPGAVTAPKSVPDKPAPTQPRKVTPPPKIATPRPVPKAQQPKAATSTPQSKAAKAQDQPKAGGTVDGGKGVDVTSVHFEGKAFDYPWYLENIVNQIRKYFTWDGPATYRADVQFFIRRDGTVADVHVLPATSSSNYSFNVAAAGTVEAVGKRKAFGPLPDGYPDEVLTVVFSFDRRIIQ